MANYRAVLITPHGKVFDDDVVSLVAPGAQGAFGVLARHTPFVANLKKGVLKLTQGQGENLFAIGSGVLEINNKHDVLILSTAALQAKNIEEAEEKMKTIEAI